MNKYLILWVILLVLLSCKKDEDNKIPAIETYPMDVGNEWTYVRQMMLKKYDGQKSLENKADTTLNFNVKVWIDKDTVLRDSLDVKVFRSREGNDSRTSDQYMNTDSEGLKTYAYSNVASNVFPLKPGYLKSFTLNLTAADRKLTNYEIIFEETPVLDIKFPLGNNTAWTYRQPSASNTLQIDKEVTGTETLELAGQKFDCYQIKWDFKSDSNYKGINITDWISDEGLIKRIMVIDTVTVLDEAGNPLYKAQATESLALKEIDIK